MIFLTLQQFNVWYCFSKCCQLFCFQDRVINLVAGLLTGLSVAVSIAVMLVIEHCNYVLCGEYMVDMKIEDKSRVESTS